MFHGLPLNVGKGRLQVLSLSPPPTLDASDVKYSAHNIAFRNAPFNRYDKRMCHNEIVDGVANACGNVWELTCFKVSVDHR